jgi:hypothetical protein
MVRFEFILPTPALEGLAMPAMSGCMASPSCAGHLELDAWWRNSPWPGGANYAALHRQKIIADKSLRYLRPTYFASDLGTGFCGNSFQAYLRRVRLAEKTPLRRLGVQSFD